MEKTITYTEEVTREEDIEICDECQREVDDDGMEYHPPNYVTEGGPTLHFCSECLNNMTDGDVQPTHVERVEEWLESNDGIGDTIVRNLKIIRQLTVLSSILSLLTILLIIFSSYLVAGIFSFIAVAFSATAILGVDHIMQAKPTKDLLR